MYHIVNDKRAKTSAHMIYDALLALLEEKPFEKISVSDIVRTSTVGRPTFYRSFDTMIDVLAMRCDECFNECFNGYLRKRVEGSNVEQHEFLLYFITYWCKNSRLIEILLSINRPDIIISSHFRCSATITKHFLPNMDMSAEEYEYFMMFRSSIFIGMMRAWINGGKKRTPEELIQYNEQLRQLISSEILL